MKFYTPFRYSARHKCIVHAELVSGDDKKKRFKYTRLSGVRDVNRKLFFPGYKYANAVLAPPGCINKKTKRSSSRPVNCAGKKDGPQKGEALGKLIMRQLEATRKIYKKYSCSQRVFYNKETRSKFARTISTAKKKEAFLKTCNTMNSNTEKIWRWFDHKGLLLIAVDHGVGDLESKRGSGMDVVCMRALETNKVTLIEVKYGYTDYLYKHTHQPMNYPFGDKNDCPLHQHFLQLLATCDLYQRTHPDHEIEQCLLLRVDRDCVEVEPIPDWCVSRRTEMIDRINQR
jgi:hypothetical protein